MQTELFNGLDDRQAATVASIGRVCTFRRGSHLCRVGDLAEHVYVVREGFVDLTAPLLVQGERTPVRLESHGPGATLGWCALVPPHGVAVDAIAGTTVVVMGFRREPLLQLVAAQPELGLRLVANAASALARQNIRLQALWLRQMQRDVTDCGGTGGLSWILRSSL